MTRALLLAAAFALDASPATALTRAELEPVAAAPAPGARLPDGLRLISGDRPAVLVFADLDCTDLCDALVAQIAEALAATGLSPAQDYQFLAVSLDPSDDAASARRLVEASVPDPALRPAVLRLDAAETARVAEALGFRAVYDAERDAFAHPAAVYVLTAAGAVARVFPGLMPAPEDLRRALAEADGSGATLLQRVALTCYAFDAETGRYTLRIERALTLSSLAAALILAAGIGVALRRERRARRP